MAKNGREGAMYAEPVEWVSPLGVKRIRNLVTNAKIYMVSIWGKPLLRWTQSKATPIMVVEVGS